MDDWYDGTENDTDRRWWKHDAWGRCLLSWKAGISCAPGRNRNAGTQPSGKRNGFLCNPGPDASRYIRWRNLFQNTQAVPDSHYHAHSQNHGRWYVKWFKPWSRRLYHQAFQPEKPVCQDPGSMAQVRPWPEASCRKIFMECRGSGDRL